MIFKKVRTKSLISGIFKNILYILLSMWNVLAYVQLCTLKAITLVIKLNLIILDILSSIFR